jgi:CspA family cold shock protein
MVKGMVKYLNDARGNGFISRNDGCDDVFFLRSDVQGDGLKTLAEGAMVEFEIENGPKGPRARNIRIL